MTHLEHSSPDFVIGVTVGPAQPPPMTFFEYCAYKIGPPPRVFKLCDWLNYGVIVFCLAYVLTWAALLREAFVHRYGLSDSETFLFSMAWAPFMVILHMVTGSLRYGAVCLLSKGMTQLTAMAHQQFFEALNGTVQAAMHQYMTEHSPPEKPTLQ